MFSILIPTWNNLALLKLCIQSIRQNSVMPHQIIVHVNEGTDGTQSWLQQEGIDYTASPENVGICFAVNVAAGLASHDYIVYLNDDMYCCPGWDAPLLNKISQLDTHNFMLSGTMIEPVATGNTCVVVADFGRDATNFNEAALLEKLPQLKTADWNGATWPPTVVHKSMWQKVGGYSTEFSPGMSSDNDFSIKMWHAGCRIFLGLGDALVYHFQCKTTGKIKKNKGGKQFLNKWGMTQSTFDQFYLQRGTRPASSTLPEPSETLALKLALWRSDIKRRLG